MDQNVLPPSQTRITELSIDSRFADQYFQGTADYMIRLPSIMRNVMRISVGSTEIPVVAYVFSKRAGNTNFTVGGAPLDISAGTYNAAGLATMVTATIGGGITCAYDASSNRFSFTNSGGAPVTLTLQSTISAIAGRSRFWGLGYNLGFRQQIVVVPAGGTVTAPASLQIDPPAYMLLQVQCPDILEGTLHRLEDGAYVQALAKVVLKNGAYVTNFDDAANMLRKENVFKQPTSLTQIRIRLLDAYGNLVDMGDTDWSVTFDVVEIVSSCLYSELKNAYGRC
jgi:hypothetical protein